MESQVLSQTLAPAKPPTRTAVRRMWTAEQLGHLFGVHPRSVWRWAKTGVMPAPLKIGPRATRWSGQAIEDFIEAKTQEAAQ